MGSKQQSTNFLRSIFRCFAFESIWALLQGKVISPIILDARPSGRWNSSSALPTSSFAFAKYNSLTVIIIHLHANSICNESKDAQASHSIDLQQTILADAIIAAAALCPSNCGSTLKLTSFVLEAGHGWEGRFHERGGHGCGPGEKGPSVGSIICRRRYSSSCNI